MLLLQSSVLLLILSGSACTMEVNGDDQVVAVEVQNLCPVQMGNIRVSDLLAGLIQGKIKIRSDLSVMSHKEKLFLSVCLSHSRKACVNISMLIQT